MVTFTTSLATIRYEYRRGWLGAKRLHGAGAWSRWAALNEVATWLAEGVATATAAGAPVDPRELELYREVCRRRDHAAYQHARTQG